MGSIWKEGRNFYNNQTFGVCDKKFFQTERQSLLEQVDKRLVKMFGGILPCEAKPSHPIDINMYFT